MLLLYQIQWTNSIVIPHLYVHCELAPERQVLLSAPQHHYLTKVMRLKAGQDVHVFNGTQGLWRAELAENHLVSLDHLLPQPPSPQKMALFFSPIKAQNWLIEKCVEVGVTDFFPILCRRTVVRHFCHTRHMKIVYEACEQSRRLNIPTIHPPAPLIKQIQNPPEPFTHSLAALMLDAPNPFSAPCSGVFIGPEGGWSPEEIALFSATPPIKPVHLGSSVLRAETAAVVASTLMRYAPSLQTRSLSR